MASTKSVWYLADFKRTGNSRYVLFEQGSSQGSRSIELHCPIIKSRLP